MYNSGEDVHSFREVKHKTYGDLQQRRRQGCIRIKLYVYIYIEIERERDVYRLLLLLSCIYIYIYIYTITAYGKADTWAVGDKRQVCGKRQAANDMVPIRQEVNKCLKRNARFA